MLNTLKINNLEIRPKAYKVSDGNGLFIFVNPSGTKCWNFRYQFGGAKSLSLGKFPAVGLKEARELRDEAARLLKENIDPSAHRRQEKQKAIRQHANSFGAIAVEWYEANKGRWTPRHAGKLWRIIEMHLLPHLGKDPVATLKPREVLDVLRKIEAKGATETSHRALWITRRIFNYAIAIDVAEANPAQNIGAGLKPHVGISNPFIAISELPEFLKCLQEVNAREQDKLATRLLLLTALRTGELRRCKWANVNWAAAEIRVPKEVMKMRDEHIVPLSRQAVETLKELHALSGHQEWLLPNPWRGKNPLMSENVVNNVIAAMGYKDRMVGHSLRKLFSTVLNEQEFNPDAIERQLAHRERSKSRAAYNLARHLQTRRFLMQWWADYLDSLLVSKPADAVLDLRQSPRNNTIAELDGLRVNPRPDTAIPGALAHGNNLKNVSEAQ